MQYLAFGVSLANFASCQLHLGFWPCSHQIL